MGSSFGIKCKECDYEKQFKLGIGMMYSPGNLEDVDSEFSLLPYLIKSKKRLNLVRGLLKDKNGRIGEFYGHKLFVCSKCRAFYERFSFKIDYDGGTFVSEYKCSKCKVLLREVEYIKSNDGRSEEIIDFSKYACPKCGNYSLFEDQTMMVMWD